MRDYWGRALLIYGHVIDRQTALALKAQVPKDAAKQGRDGQLTVRDTYRRRRFVRAVVGVILAEDQEYGEITLLDLDAIRGRVENASKKLAGFLAAHSVEVPAQPRLLMWVESDD
jgi:hypothetical protein